MTTQSFVRHTVLVTGGSRGIGQAIARRYAAEGHKVIAPPRSDLDLASANSIKRYLTGHADDRIDILINNAAENRIYPLEALPLDAWERMIAVNLTAPLLLIRAAAASMARLGWGRIVNIGSVYGLVGRPGRAAYSSTKAALNALTRTAALEYAESGVLVNAVCPGFVDTELTRTNNSAEELESLRRRVPMRRFAAPEEIAELVYFIGSERNTYITGQVIAIDGGLLAG